MQDERTSIRAALQNMIGLTSIQPAVMRAPMANAYNATPIKSANERRIAIEMGLFLIHSKHPANRATASIMVAPIVAVSKKLEIIINPKADPTSHCVMGDKTNLPFARHRNILITKRFVTSVKSHKDRHI